MNITNIVKIIKNIIKNYALHFLLLVLIVLTAISICLINKDIQAINDIKRDKNSINAKIESHNKKANILIQKDTVNKSDILMFQSEGIDLKKELHDFENNKEEEIKDLYMHEMKYWAYLIALLVSLFVFIGIKWNFHEYVTKRLASLFDENKDDFEKLIRDKSWEFSLIKKAHIMVVDLNPYDENEYINKVLKWFGLKGSKDSIEYLRGIDSLDPDVITEKSKPKKGKFNILLLDNSGENGIDLNETENTDAAKELAVKLHNDIYLVYYGPRDKGFFPSSDFTKEINDNNKNISNENIMNRISFANAPSKLYVSLVETLKYMDILNDDINA